MTLNLQIDRENRAEQPLYRQIADQIIRAVQDGSLPRGSRLPTVRDLADRLGITRVTAHNAYSELKAEGWIDATVGSGTYVAGPRPSITEPVETVIPSAVTPDNVMEDMSRLSHMRGTLSLAMAEPDPKLYPAATFLRLLRSMERHGEDLFRYGPYQGEPDLRYMISGLLSEKGIRVQADDILVTTGVTQGLSLAIAALCGPGDKVIVERPTYLGFLGLLESYGVEPIGVPLDQDGPRLDVLEKLLHRVRPRVLYTIPSFQNPTGICMSEDRRARLLSLAAEHELVIIEDDIYGRLAYDGPTPRPLKALDHEDRVLYLDSFSKALLPGLRVGYAVAPGPVKERMISLLRVRELCGSSLSQRALAEFIRRGHFHEHLSRVVPAYRSRRDALVDALARTMPEGVEWTYPRGGYCAWVCLPEAGDFGGLYRAAVSRGVAFTPGEVFLNTADKRKYMRLCFSFMDEARIREAVRTLGEILTELMGSRVTPSVAPPRGPKPIV